MAMRAQYQLLPNGETRQVEHALGPAVTFVTWRELFDDLLRRAGTVAHDEHVPSFQTDDRGLTVTLAPMSGEQLKDAESARRRVREAITHLVTGRGK